MKIECDAMDNIETAGKAYLRSEENRCHEVFKAIELTSDLYKNKPTDTVAMEGIAKLLNATIEHKSDQGVGCTKFFEKLYDKSGFPELPTFSKKTTKKT